MISQDYTDHYTIWCTKHSTHHPLYIQVCMNNVCVLVYRVSYFSYEKPKYLFKRYTILSIYSTTNDKPISMCTRIYMGFINQQMRRLRKESPQIQKTITEVLCSHNESVEHARSVQFRLPKPPF